MAPVNPDDSGYVWIVETGDYEQRYIVLVAASLEAAIAAIEAVYPAPYRVRWESPTFDPDLSRRGPLASVVGHFDAVPGYSTRHSAQFDIERHPIAGHSE